MERQKGYFEVIQAKYRNRLPLPQPAVVHVRRSYAECRFGQIHLSTAYPSGGGFDEHTPVVCLHHSWRFRSIVRADAARARP